MPSPAAGGSPSKLFGAANEDENVKPLPDSEFEDFLGRYDRSASQISDLDEFIKQDDFKFNQQTSLKQRMANIPQQPKEMKDLYP
jgi:hypothetical protein